MQKTQTRHNSNFTGLSSNYSFSGNITDKKPNYISQHKNPLTNYKEVK